MQSLNQTLLIGNVGKNPDVLSKNEKGTFVSFSLATNKQYTNRQGDIREEVQWHQVRANNGLGTALVAHLKKGMRVFVSGELRYEKWTDQKGKEHQQTVIFASRVDFLSALDQKKSSKKEINEAETEVEVAEDSTED